ncbi:hypothetical protein [Acinetobacter baylyi]|nr:hypothetical protein [Acinetobacter baylyi]MDR6185757.1 hypothetical protein [Acinetobacter baylyi]
MFEDVLGGISIAQRPERYVSLDTVKSKIHQKSQKISLLNQFNFPQDVDLILKEYPEANGWISLKDMVVLINKEQEKVISIINLRPWK